MSDRVRLHFLEPALLSAQEGRGGFEPCGNIRPLLDQTGYYRGEIFLHSTLGNPNAWALRSQLEGQEGIANQAQCPAYKLAAAGSKTE